MAAVGFAAAFEGALVGLLSCMLMYVDDQLVLVLERFFFLEAFLPSADDVPPVCCDMIAVGVLHQFVLCAEFQMTVTPVTVCLHGAYFVLFPFDLWLFADFVVEVCFMSFPVLLSVARVWAALAAITHCVLFSMVSEQAACMGKEYFTCMISEHLLGTI